MLNSKLCTSKRPERAFKAAADLIHDLEKKTSETDLKILKIHYAWWHIISGYQHDEKWLDYYKENVNSIIKYYSSYKKNLAGV